MHNTHPKTIGRKNWSTKNRVIRTACDTHFPNGTWRIILCTVLEHSTRTLLGNRLPFIYPVGSYRICNPVMQPLPDNRSDWTDQTKPDRRENGIRYHINTRAFTVSYQ